MLVDQNSNSMEAVSELQQEIQYLQTLLQHSRSVLAEQKQCLEKICQDIMGKVPSYHSLNELAEIIREHFENIIACMPGNVFWTDRNSVYLGCNNNVARMLGLKSRQEFAGMTFDRMAKICGWKEGQENSFKKDDQEVMKTGIPKINVEEPPIENADGKPTYFLSNRMPLYDKKNNITGMVGISIDITQRKEMEIELVQAKEKAESALLTKTEFIRNMSHDLRTPLTGIIGSLDILKTQIKDAALKDYAAQSYEAAFALLSTFNAILESSKKEYTEHLEETTFSLSEIVNGIKKLYQPAAVTKGLELTTTFDEKIPPFVKGNARILERILINLTGNAIKFTDAGHVHIAAKLLDETPETIRVAFSIKDTGCGIPKDQHEEIFQPFSRLTSSYDSNIEGSGLGLHIVSNFMELLKGRISVESEINQGSTFIAEIPFKPVAQKPIIADSIENISPEKINHLSVLLVEDNLLAQKVTKYNLENWGYQVDVANDGKEAIGKCQKNLYGLIYMDIGLPNGLNGCDTTQIIKDTTFNKNTPVVALTAHADQKLEQSCLSSGVCIILEKPITKEKADKVFRDLLDDAK